LRRDTINENDFKKLITSRHVGFFQEDKHFFMNLFSYFSMDTSKLNLDIFPKYKTVEQGIWHIDHSKTGVICLFNVIPSNVIKKLLRKGWSPVAIIQPEDDTKGSALDGFCLTYPGTYPYMIPQYIYGEKQNEPILSIATDYILAANESADERMIYELVRDIIQGKASLSQINVTAAHLTENFNRSALTLPLHKGALAFFDRDKPSFFVRYAEPIGLALSILMVIAGSLTRLKKLKKERIDKYYKKVMLAESQEELIALKEKAIMQLEDEKLSADEGFNIFLTIVEQKMTELERQKNRS